MAGGSLGSRQLAAPERSELIGVDALSHIAAAVERVRADIAQQQIGIAAPRRRSSPARIGSRPSLPRITSSRVPSPCARPST